ncbi:MAG: phosphoglycolate phosphatase [Gammaproteobacteria bacterium]|nr:phosphoglycolate phosphatase [Gammaproteobacteria bacterium]
MSAESSWQRPYRGYLFDLDGTLVDTAPDIGVALNTALERKGYQPASDDHTRHWVGHGARVLLEQALEHQQQPFDAVEEMLEIFITHYAEHIADRSTLYPDVVASLAALRARGAKLALVTNKLTSLSVALLEALELQKFFDVLVCGDNTHKPKPAGDPAIYAGKRLHLGMDEVLFVGDSQTDVACARAAGCSVVCVANGYNHGTGANALGADGVIETLKDLV